MPEQTRPSPENVSPWHPVTLIVTWFGTGFLPKAPGTWGSLAALPLAWVVTERFGPIATAALGLALAVIGVFAANAYLRHRRAKDPPEIVIDEVAAQLIAVAPAGLDPLAFGLAFVLFRILDIMKPWPIRALERLEGGLGVMADDIAAGLCTAALVILFFILTGKPSVFL